jgi:hypothetical protein
VPDQTNITDFDPATGTTTTTLVSDHDRGAADVAEANGQEHDTWHRDDLGGGGGTPVSGQTTGLVNFYDEGTGGEFKVEDGTSFTDESLPPIGAELTVAVNGTTLGRYRLIQFGDPGGPGEFGAWAAFAEATCAAVDLNGVDHTAFLQPMDGQTATIAWST